MTDLTCHKRSYKDMVHIAIVSLLMSNVTLFLTISKNALSNLTWDFVKNIVLYCIFICCENRYKYAMGSNIAGTTRLKISTNSRPKGNIKHRKRYAVRDKNTRKTTSEQRMVFCQSLDFPYLPMHNSVVSMKLQVFNKMTCQRLLEDR